MRNNLKKLLLTAAVLVVAAAPLDARNRGTSAADTSVLDADFRVSLYDPARERVVPVAVYKPRRETNKTKVVIFSHGYGKNRSVDNCVRNGWLTRRMADQGYYVISIQHELTTDAPLSEQDDIYAARMPFWQRGCDNIMFVIETFNRIKPSLDWTGLTLVGHSMGGDTSMMFAGEHPDMVSKVITLDHCRVKIPRTSWPRIYTLRACNTTPGQDVLPTAGECRTYGITVEYMDGVRHRDMGSRGSAEQHERVAARVCDFLRRDNGCDACRAWRRTAK